jgi:HK97 family phage portal protein
MKLNPFRIFSKKEQESTPACEGNFAALIPGLNSQLYRNKQYDLAANQTLEYYQQCAPLHDAITRIVLEVAAIEPEIYDKQKNVFVQNHKLLDLLNNPNAISSYEDFVTEIATSYLLTANTFLTADGDINRPPASLNVIPPPYIRYDLAADGYVKSWNIESLYLNLQYLREMAKLRYRYYNQMKTSELYQIRGFSWYSSNCKIWGISQLNSIWYEIEQYIISSIHNLSVLDKGATISGVFSTAEMLSDEAYERLRAEITNLYSGAGNAGRSLFAEGDLKFNAISQSNRDMDFATLKDKVTKQIYKNLKIPLPLIDEGTMTLANLEASALLLYDNAVLPLVKRIFSELTRFLMPRYPNSDNLVLWFDDNKITALEPRRLANLKQKAELNVLTANEIRKDIQMPPFANGADQLYQPATLIPYADTIEQPK